MTSLYFITHLEAIVDPETPIERWDLSAKGIERMRKFAASPTPANIKAIWSSTEAKAIEAAGTLAGALGLGIRVAKELGENDRSATGFLPPEEFETVEKRFPKSQPTIQKAIWRLLLMALSARCFSVPHREFLSADIMISHFRDISGGRPCRSFALRKAGH
jgi:broad specificity phosphatase PhoE